MYLLGFVHRRRAIFDDSQNYFGFFFGENAHRVMVFSLFLTEKMP
jgi:hypothetical protein